MQSPDRAEVPASREDVRAIDAGRCVVAEDALSDVDRYVCEGWWHPNVKSGQVHDHPENPGGGWSSASHRLCELVYTKRDAR